MIFDIFISRKSANLLHKLDEDLKEMLSVFYTLEDRYKRKIKFLKRCEEVQERGKVTAWGGKAILNEISKLLRIIGIEEKADKIEDKYSNKALDILKELLERWRTNRKLVRLTYQEYSDLSILHECLRNLVSILHRQREWLKKHLSNSQSFIKNFPEFKEFVKQEGIIIGKEKESTKEIGGETHKIENEYSKTFAYSLVGYGSLMSADQTMNELRSILDKTSTPVIDIDQEFNQRVTPVWVVGYKRVFNMADPGPAWKPPPGVNKRVSGVLNVIPSIRDKFNGVAIKLTENEFKVIRTRERSYGIITLKHVYDYRTGRRMSESCICVKSNFLKVDIPIPVDKKERLEFYAQRIKKLGYGQDPDRLIKKNLLPMPKYIEAVDMGVRKLDSLLGTVGMYDNYLNTTYCNYIDLSTGKDYGEIRLIDYYKLIDKEIDRRLQLNVI